MKKPRATTFLVKVVVRGLFLFRNVPFENRASYFKSCWLWNPFGSYKLPFI